jgi:hypothetical protein
MQMFLKTREVSSVKHDENVTGLTLAIHVALDWAPKKTFASCEDVWPYHDAEAAIR